LLSRLCPDIMTGTHFYVPPMDGQAHLFTLLKSAIVLSSWVCAYVALKHLPISLVSPMQATRPMWTLIGALILFGERLNVWQWLGVLLALGSIFAFSFCNKSNLKHQTSNILPLGSIGHLAAFSFHETKNITAGGEGGLLVVNDERFVRRAEIIWEKGTNRAEFFRGEVNKYGWVDMGSSFLPSEVNAAFLWAQLENLDAIQAKRKTLWNSYYQQLKPLADKGCFSMPDIPEYATNNAHMFYLVLPSLEARTALIKYLKENGVGAVFHYLSLHSSEFYKNRHDGRQLPECDRYADCLVRLPLFYDLTLEQVNTICELLKTYYQ